MVIMLTSSHKLFTNLLVVLHLYFPAWTEATTEWFGDLRAHLNPPNSPPFYDVTYDDTDCPMGMQSNAIPEFVYFGEMVATKSVKEHSTCLQMCLQNSRCKAVNFFEPLTNKEKGFCELLSESQYDNPRLMRPFKKAIYYERIRCRAPEDEQEYLLGDETHTTNTHNSQVSSTAQKQLEGDVSSSAPPRPRDWKTSEPSPLGGSSSSNTDTSTQDQQEESTKSREEGVEESTTRPKLFKKSEALSILKKLAAKVHEFNLRFRSR